MKSRLIRKRKVLWISLVSITLLSCNRITDWFISDQQEVEMGQNFAAEIEKDKSNFPLENPNSPVSRYIDSIGQAIVRAQKDRTTIDYTFKVVKQDTVVNAFAVPGGFIYIYTGLIRAARNEAEIAGVVAHEVAHVTKRHGAQLMMRDVASRSLLDMIVGDSTALRTALDLVKGFTFLQYSQKNEFEADSCSVEYLISAGYNPRGMETFLGYLDSLSGQNAWGVLGKIGERLSTHPPAGDRVKRVQSIIGRNPGSEQLLSPPKRL